MLVVVGKMIDHAGLARMQVAAAQFLGGDDFARCCLHQRRPGKEDRALFAHDHRLVAHRRHIGPARRARPHDAGDLRNAAGRHLRLIVKAAPEMIAVGEDLGLHRQERAAAVDKVDARQAVFRRDLLRAQVLLDGQRIIGAAFHRGVVAHDHALAARDAANASDHARPRCLVAVHAVRRKLAQFEERRAGIEQPLDAVPR